MAPASAAAKTPQPIDTSKGITIIAGRAMWRAGKQWPAGATDLTSAECDAIGQDKLQSVAADPNFTVVAFGAKAVTVAAPMGTPIVADTVVVAKRTMWRVGQQWQAGTTPLTSAQVKKLGADKIATLKADPNFSVVENDAAIAAGQKAEADAKSAAADAAKKAAADAAIAAAVAAMSPEDAAAYAALSQADKAKADAGFVQAAAKS